MVTQYFRIAGRCPLYESIRTAKGLELGPMESRDLTPRCNHCSYWNGGSCDLMLARGSN